MVTYRLIEGTEGSHRVGDDGSVWSRFCQVGNIGCWILSDQWRKLKGNPNTDGYSQVKIRGKRKRVHRLVLEAFVSSCPPGMEAAHNNGDPADNRLENLRWATRIENMADKIRHGTSYQGEAHDRSVFTEDQVRRIRKKHSQGRSIPYLTDLYEVSKPAIRKIVHYKSWKHVK